MSIAEISLYLTETDLETKDGVEAVITAHPDDEYVYLSVASAQFAMVGLTMSVDEAERLIEDMQAVIKSMRAKP